MAASAEEGKAVKYSHLAHLPFHPNGHNDIWSHWVPLPFQGFPMRAGKTCVSGSELYPFSDARHCLASERVKFTENFSCRLLGNAVAVLGYAHPCSTHFLSLSLFNMYFNYMTKQSIVI